VDKFKRSAKIFLMATAMFSNFFVSYTAEAANPPPAPPTTYTTSTTPAITYGLNIAYKNDDAWGGFDISIDAIYGAGVDSFSMPSNVKDYQQKNTDGTVANYPAADYVAYLACDATLFGANICENDILTSDHLRVVIQKSSRRVVAVGKLTSDSESLLTPYLPGQMRAISASSNSPAEPVSYAKQRPAVLQALDDIVARLKNNQTVAVAASIDPKANLDASLKQMGSYTDRRHVSSQYFKSYFNECDVNYYTVIHFPNESASAYDGGVSTTPERDKVAKDPTPQNRPVIDIGDGNNLKAMVDKAKANWLDWGFPNSCDPLPSKVLARPATTWQLEKTGKTGNSGFWQSVGVNATLDRAIFYFKMKTIPNPGNNHDIKNLNDLSNYVYLCIQVYGNEIYADWAYSDFGFSAENLVLKGVVGDVNNETKYPLARTFALNIAQFTFNAGVCETKTVTVVQQSQVNSAGVTKGPNPILNLSGKPTGMCPIDSSYKFQDYPGITGLQFARSINDIQKTPPPGQTADPAAAYYGYLSAWGIVGYNTMGSSTVGSNQYNADKADQSCGCGDVSGSNIMNILKRAFCAVICWTFNVGKGLQENATCLFNDALGTIGRKDKARGVSC